MTSRAMRETDDAARVLKAPAKLHYPSASPFVRKVMASAIELGLDGFLTLDPAANPTMPTVRNPAIAFDNPLSKIPTLVLADGERLFDSIVICEYLDEITGGNRLFPPTGMSRWRALWSRGQQSEFFMGFDRSSMCPTHLYQRGQRGVMLRLK